MRALLLQWLWPIIGAIIGLLVLFGVVQTVRVYRLQAEWSTERTEYAKRALIASERAREAEAQLSQFTSETVNEAQRLMARARAAADANDALAPRMRNAVTVALERACPPNPTAPDGGASAAEARRVLADVFRQIQDRQRKIDRFADQSWSAATSCQVIHEKIRTK